MSPHRRGFTLVELVIVVVIIGILAAIAIPNWMAMRDRALESEVKMNARASQSYLKDYASEHSDSYPAGIAEHMNAQPRLRNPFGGDAFSDGRVTWQPGVCCYLPSPDGMSYEIVALGKDGSEILLLSSDE